MYLQNVEGSVFDQFCANFSKDDSTGNGYCQGFVDRIIPVNYPAHRGIRELAHLGAYPELIYVDCDLEYPRLKHLLMVIMDKVWNRQPCHIAGGGWNISSVS